MPRPNVEAERRGQILEAACRVIAEIGFTQLRVADVAKAAAVSSGTVHYYFASKRAVIAAAFEYNFQHSLETRRQLLSADQDAMTLLQDLVESYLPDLPASLQAWRVWAELWVEGTRDLELQRINDNLYGEWRQLVVDIIAKAQLQGQAREGDPTELANMLLGMIDGLAMQVLVRSESLTLARMRSTVQAFIAHLIAEPVASAVGAS